MEKLLTTIASGTLILAGAALEAYEYIPIVADFVDSLKLQFFDIIQIYPDYLIGYTGIILMFFGIGLAVKLL